MRERLPARHAGAIVCAGAHGAASRRFLLVAATQGGAWVLLKGVAPRRKPEVE